MTKLTYYGQPYEVGTKKSRSLVLVIPATLARENGITKNTLFAIQADQKTRTVTLQTVKVGFDKADNKKEQESSATSPADY